MSKMGLFTKSIIDYFRKALIEGLLMENNGNLSEVARILEMDRSNVYRIAKGYGIDLNKYRKENENGSEKNL